MKLKLIFSLFIFFLAAQKPAAQTWEWLKNGGGADADVANAVATDGAGNVYVTGYFTGSMVWGDKKLTADGLEDIFIAKISPEGKTEWLVKAGGPEKDAGYGIAVDAEGAVWVTGMFTQSAKFDLKAVKSNGFEDIFVAKYDKTGKCIWVKHAGGAGEDIAYAITVDPKGRAYLCGYFDEKGSFDKIEVTGKESRDIFLASYSKTGEALWVKTAGGLEADNAYSISLDTEGNVYIGGVIVGDATFEDKQVDSEGLEDIFVAKYKNDGTLLWVKDYGGKDTDFCSGMATDRAGNIYITGYYKNICQFGGHALACLNCDDMFVVKLDPNGEALWVQSAGGQGMSNGNSLTTDAAGNAYVTGYFQKTVAFNDQLKKSAGGSDIFVAKYLPDGKVAWVATLGADETESANSVAVSPNGTVYIAGEFEGKTVINQTPINAVGAADCLVAKIKP